VYTGRTLVLGVVFICEESLTARMFALQQKAESQILFSIYLACWGSLLSEIAGCVMVFTTYKPIHFFSAPCSKFYLSILTMYKKFEGGTRTKSGGKYNSCFLQPAKQYCFTGKKIYV